MSETYRITHFQSSVSCMIVTYVQRVLPRNSPMMLLSQSEVVTSSYTVRSSLQLQRSRLCVLLSICPSKFKCVSSLCQPPFYSLLPLLLSSPLPLTLTVKDLSTNGQLNALILAKTAWRRITYESWLGYLSVNGGSLAFGGIWGPLSQDDCRSFVC